MFLLYNRNKKKFKKIYQKGFTNFWGYVILIIES
ncbi:hypothetical protein TwortDSMZ_207 [Staphylococcus phage Twort]|uniref:Uncharacterized protein n=2 Tax=Staphylococcus phage Twort (strain DSM 17442 / HER 48) TaxID=2908167 RepID=A0A6H0X5T0_BPTWO|nr:ORF408 [Staphylococcus phage Twort]AAX92491.1 ORF408 [Staphylococcus phage Twort]QIW89212.1 hypothetical protein TwortDSMZ_018 [Staphylococcus phage Twort]QIW89223.1 hypothetical protein TwortDSMZ_207 [Staphylococcus phage Twort]